MKFTGRTVRVVPGIANLLFSRAYGETTEGGNSRNCKRTAWVVCAVFLELNGITVIADQAAVVENMLALAAAAMDAQQFAEWLRSSNITQ